MHAEEEAVSWLAPTGLTSSVSFQPPQLTQPSLNITTITTLLHPVTKPPMQLDRLRHIWHTASYEQKTPKHQKAVKNTSIRDHINRKFWLRFTFNSALSAILFLWRMRGRPSARERAAFLITFLRFKISAQFFKMNRRFSDRPDLCSRTNETGSLNQVQ